MRAFARKTPLRPLMIADAPRRYRNVWDQDGFLMQLVCLILAPSFISGAIDLVLTHVVLTFGSEYSRLPATWYTWLFIGLDAFSILLQAIGGGLASVSTLPAALRLAVRSPEVFNAVRFQRRGQLRLTINRQQPHVSHLNWSRVNYADLPHFKARGHCYSGRPACALRAGLPRIWISYMDPPPYDRYSRFTGTTRPTFHTQLSMVRHRLHSRLSWHSCALLLPVSKCSALAGSLIHSYEILRTTARMASIPELAQGWGGELMRDELTFLVLDGA